MSDPLFSGEIVDLSEMLAARERRVQRQRQFLGKRPTAALLSATMNIPGAVKNSPALLQIFQELVPLTEAAVRGSVLAEGRFFNEKTGSEYYLLTALAPEELKQRMVLLEEAPRGRLFDLDVLYLKDGTLASIGRQELDLPPRRCFVCSETAKACGRSRKHSLEEMQRKIMEIVEKGRAC